MLIVLFLFANIETDRRLDRQVLFLIIKRNTKTQKSNEETKGKAIQTIYFPLKKETEIETKHRKSIFL
jgi:hypothetical protein